MPAAEFKALAALIVVHNISPVLPGTLIHGKNFSVMRPSILFPLFVPITSLKGIGPRLGPLYKRLAGEHVADLLWHLPVTAIDRNYSPELKYADRDRIATLTLNIVEHAPPNKPSLPYRIVGTDGSDQVIITYFNVKGDYLSRMYPTDHKVVVSGMLGRFRG